MVMVGGLKEEENCQNLEQKVQGRGCVVFGSRVCGCKRLVQFRFSSGLYFFCVTYVFVLYIFCVIFVLQFGVIYLFCVIYLCYTYIFVLYFCFIYILCCIFFLFRYIQCFLYFMFFGILGVLVCRLAFQFGYRLIVWDQFL